MPATNTRPPQVPLRAKRPDLFDVLKLYAGHHGRSLNAELNLACELHLHRHALHILDEPEVIKAKGKAKIAAERLRIEAEIAALEAQAFKRSSPVDLLSS